MKTLEEKFNEAIQILNKYNGKKVAVISNTRAIFRIVGKLDFKGEMINVKDKQNHFSFILPMVMDIKIIKNPNERIDNEIGMELKFMDYSITMLFN